MRKIFVVGILLLFITFFYYCTSSVKQATTNSYVGSGKCQTCHKKEFDLFKKSDHYHAMDTVSDEVVKGDFNNSHFIYFGDTAFFYRRNGQYFVRTTDTNGIKKSFRITYTFGWQPLQQYLVRFDDGRIQVLPFCWDTREKDKGGQRWFHLYDKEKIAPDDELFWMGYNQNWNYMCADCHTTNFSTNFDAQQNNFHSTWDETRVSCESCHGPASGHLNWTNNKSDVSLKGFGISLKSKSVNWKMDLAKQTLVPENAVKNDTLIETCARCHARASRFSDAYQHGGSFLQTHIPSTVDPVNYHVDGQIKEEDYEYGSFLQSKMYAMGVTCTNCHDAHSMKIKATGNALCGSCHVPNKYDGPQHSYHKASSTGNQCVSCHMPVTTYMVVDNRLDHSIRIPRPDQSLIMGTPNACNKCHVDKSVSWAASNFNKWYQDKVPKEKSYAELMYNISRFVNESEPSLYELLVSKNYPAIIRATAMEQYGSFTSARVSGLVYEELKNADPAMRLNALKAMANYPAEKNVAYATPLLYDQVSAVRMEAMILIAPIKSTLTEKDDKQFNMVMSEYFKVQENMSHRPEGFFNRAILKYYTGTVTEAEQLYLTCLDRFPVFIPAYSNLIDLYRQENREEDAKRIIDRGMSKNPNNPFIHYALGLWYVRKKDNSTAMKEMLKAFSIAPDNAQFVYGYAIGLFSEGQKLKAVQIMENFINKYGNNATITEGLVAVCTEMKLTDKAKKYADLQKSVFGY